MNNKGQMAQVGTFMMMFIGVIVAIAFITGGISSNIGQTTQTANVVNNTITFPANGVFLQLDGQAVSGLILTNASNGALVPTSNYTVTNYNVVNGDLQGGITGKTSANYNGKLVNASYTYEPQGYATDSGTRAIIVLILILAALAIAAYVLGQAFDKDLLAIFK